MYSSADGHLGWFHVLAIVNSASVNIGMHVSFQLEFFVFFFLFFFFLDICPEVGMFDHMVALVLFVKEPLYYSP